MTSPYELAEQFLPLTLTGSFMHQSIPAAPFPPPPPPGNCGTFARIVSPGGRALAYARATLGLLTHTWFLTQNPNEDDFIGKDQ